MRVKTTPQFEQAIDKLMNCSTEIYSTRTIRSVYTAYKRYKALLSEQPYLGSEEPILCNMPVTFRHIIIKPNFKFIYAIVDNEIHMIDIWDTRQDPDRLRSRID